jgi:hypothetical protein
MKSESGADPKINIKVKTGLVPNILSNHIPANNAANTMMSVAQPI